MKNFENDFVEFLRIAHPINIYWSVHPFLLFHDLDAGGYADLPLHGAVPMCEDFVWKMPEKNNWACARRLNDK